MMEIFFLLSFTLHNIEEALWLPRWSAHAGAFHRPVSRREFHFAVMAVTVAGYLVTFLHLAFGKECPVLPYAFYGFVAMMSLNAIAPHLAATIAMRRYAPGTLTGLCLNLPAGAFIIHDAISRGAAWYFIALAALAATALTVPLLGPLFRLGAKLLDEY